VGPFAREVGPAGRVYAVDIVPAFVKHIDQRARELGLPQVEARLCAQDDVQLPAGSIDIAFVCDVYHHFEFPRSSLESVHAALRPGGELVVIDFVRVPGVSREWILQHVRAGQEVFTSEIEAAGFELVEEVAVEGLEENYFLRFRKE
jgi:ubiquinone/menaquinone biosynthesis C-methylase UbiE